jgi:chromate reductase, NAD(P)H dehydrogenase (quinone)
MSQLEFRFAIEVGSLPISSGGPSTMTGRKMRILAISGSLRAKSSNTAVLMAAARLAPPDMEVALYDGLANLPHFNPDLDTDRPPAAVLALRNQVGSCQGLLLCSPEYARGVAGVMKNALDWLVSSLEFPGKPIALINASQRATCADAQLRLILATMSARLVEAASMTLPLLGRPIDADGIVSDQVLSAQLRTALDCFAQAIAANGNQASS